MIGTSSSRVQPRPKGITVLPSSSVGKIPHGEVQQPCGATTPVYFKDEDLSIVAVDPRYVVVRVHSPALKCLVLACHAPHTGSSPQDRSEFWQELQQSYSPRYAAWDKILLGDLNCRLGSELSQAVGPHQAEASTKEDPCHDFLLESQIWLPATFPDYQQGPSLGSGNVLYAKD